MTHHRSHTDTSGPGQMHAPTKPPVHDKFKDLMAYLVNDPITKENPGPNPTLGELLDLKPR